MVRSSAGLTLSLMICSVFANNANITIDVKTTGEKPARNSTALRVTSPRAGAIALRSRKQWKVVPASDSDTFEEQDEGVSKCRTKCLGRQVCVKNECMADPCEGSCGEGLMCVVGRHRHRCVPRNSPVPGRRVVKPSGPGCSFNNECPKRRSCVNRNCVDPCASLCGKNAVCQVENHHASCACIAEYTGNPFKKCKLISLAKISDKKETKPLSNRKKLYFVMNIKKTWAEALVHCRSVDMDLAVIENEKQQAEVERIIDDPNLDEGLWTAATDLGTTGSFIWIATGGSLTYTNWRAGEPNGHISHCMGVRPGDNKWIAFQCSSKRFFLCEYLM